MDVTRLERLATTIGEGALHKFINATISDIVAVRGRISEKERLLPDEFRACAHKLVGLFSQSGLVDAAAIVRKAMSGPVEGQGEAQQLIGMCDDAVKALHAFSSERLKQTG